ncbi:MAG: PaaI family thioesterase [Eubacterium sp.]|nr:PaaI family thioesterase [Eubacterium sp.]
MATFQSLEEAREFFKGDQFATKNGMQLDSLSETGCVCSMELRDDHRNAYGGVMGGVIFTLADFALAITSNQIHRLSVAQQVSINYLSAPKGNKLIASAECIKDGRTSTIVNVSVKDDTGRDVAFFTGTAFKIR